MNHSFLCQRVFGGGSGLLVKGLKGLFGFLTILPIGMESMEALSKYFFLCPILGLVLERLLVLLVLVHVLFCLN